MFLWQLAVDPPVQRSGIGHKLMYEFSVRISGGGCSLARGLDRYTATHESTDGAFRFDGRDWLGGVYSRAHGHTYFNYVTSGRVPIIVWITALLSARRLSHTQVRVRQMHMQNGLALGHPAEALRTGGSRA